MPRYFFDVTDGAFAPDELGADLNGLTEARTEAAMLAGALLRDSPARFWDEGEWKVEVRAASGPLLFTLTLAAKDEPAVT